MTLPAQATSSTPAELPGQVNEMGSNLGSQLATCHPPQGKDKNITLPLKASTSARPLSNVPQTPLKVRAADDGAQKWNFFFCSLLLVGTPLRAAAWSWVLHNPEGHRSHDSVELGPLELGSMVAL